MNVNVFGERVFAGVIKSLLDQKEPHAVAQDACSRNLDSMLQGSPICSMESLRCTGSTHQHQPANTWMSPLEKNSPDQKKYPS